MSRNGNGHKGNGNGAVKKVWDLEKDGILWRKVVAHSTKAFTTEANTFVAHLQDSVQPADALQGLLLDRMAASYLRKQLLLEMESLARAGKRAKALGGSPSPEEREKPTSITIQFPIQSLVSPEVLRYEALLDQGFQRDLILLLKLKEIASGADREEKAARKPERKLIEGASSVV
jgi:hypothetical protein